MGLGGVLAWWLDCGCEYVMEGMCYHSWMHMEVPLYMLLHIHGLLNPNKGLFQWYLKVFLGKCARIWVLVCNS